MSVPIIDFAPFHHGTELEQTELATRITQELQKNGTVRLINHGISVEMIRTPGMTTDARCERALPVKYIAAKTPRVRGDMTALDLHRKRVGQLYVDA